MRWFGGFLVLLLQTSLFGQGIDVEFDKSYDFSRYKTFRVERGEVIIPNEYQHAEPKVVHTWMIHAVTTKLTSKGLMLTDSAADLTVTYVIGARKQKDNIDLGPQILTGGSGNTSSSGKTSKTWSREYQAGFIFIDLIDRGKNIRWKIKATTAEGSVDDEGLIQETVNAGFKKFSLKPKKKKK